jgi:hypothetical protein
MFNIFYQILVVEQPIPLEKDGWAFTMPLNPILKNMDHISIKPTDVYQRIFP